METEQFQEIKEQNDELVKQLKKRNSDYIFKLRKQLFGKVTVERQEEALNEILPKLIEGQKAGKNANQIYGTVQECANKIIEGPKKEVKPLKKWQIWLDNTLILFTVLSGFSALMSFIPSKNPEASQGMMRITSLVISAMIGGLVFYFFNKYIYQYDLPGADKKKKPSFGKQMLIMALGIILWMFGMNAAMLLPSIINPILPSIVLIILAAISYGIRYYLRKKIGYTGTFFAFPDK